MAFDILNQSVSAQVTAAYVGFFGRAPDPEGLNFWIGEYNSNVNDALAGIDDPSDAEVTAARKTALSNVASSFATDQEGLDTYPFLQTPNLATEQSAANFVNDVFNNLFGRSAEGEADDTSTGLGFWTQEVLDRLTNTDPDFIGTVIVDIMSGASDEDAAALENKIAVGEQYANEFAAAFGEGAEWTTDDDIDGARSVVDGVDGSEGSVQSAQGEIQQIIDLETGAQEPPPEPPTTETKELSTGVDDIDGDNVSVTVFEGAVGTLTTGDNLDGGTNDGDTLEVAMRGGENEVARLTDIEIINVRSIDDGAGTENTLNLNDATGVEEVNVVDKGGDSAGLAVNGIDPGSPTLNLTGDETVGVEVLDDTGEITDDDANGDEVNVGVNAFDGELNLRNGIETVNLEVASSSDNAFTLSQTEDGTFEQLIVTDEAAPTPPDDGSNGDGNGDDKSTPATPGNTVITSAVASLYDYSASAGDHTLNLTTDDPSDAVTVLGGSGANTVNFGRTMNGISDPGGQDTVKGGDGIDEVSADINLGITVQPAISEVEIVSLTFSGADAQNGEFDASDVEPFDVDGQQFPVFVVGDSENFANINEIRGANPVVEVIGNLSDGAEFDATTGTADELTVNFASDSTERVDIKVSGGDLEIDDATKVNIQVAPAIAPGGTGTGEGEVYIENAVFLNDFTEQLRIATTKEDDPNTDNDGDLIISGEERDSALTGTAAITDLYFEAVNGNIFVGDGSVASNDDAMDDASGLERLNGTADNATLSVGDIGQGPGTAATNLDEVHLKGMNRGVFNFDDIEGVNGNSDDDRAINASFGQQGAVIEKFTVETAFRSENDEDFEVDGQSNGFPFDVPNDIDDISANVIEDMRLTIAEFGDLSIGEVASSIEELTITNGETDGDDEDGVEANLWMFGEQVDGGQIAGAGTMQPSDPGYLPFFVEDVEAVNTANLMLDFRDFAGLDNRRDAGFEPVPSSILIGDQDTVGTGVRFDLYEADMTVTAGDGDHKGTDDGPGDEFVGTAIDPTAGDDDNDDLPDHVENDMEDEDALEVAGVNHDNEDFFGIVTGFGDDSVTTGSGSSYIYTGYGDDTVVAGGGGDLVDAGPGFNDVTLGASPDEAADTHVLKRPDKVVDVGVRTLDSDLNDKIVDGYDLVRDFEEGSGDDVTELYGFDQFFSDFSGGLPDSGGNVTITEIDLNVDTASPGGNEARFRANNDSVEMFEVLFDFVNIDATGSPTAQKQEQIEDDFMANIADNLDFSEYGNEKALFLVYDRDEQDTNTNAALLEGNINQVNDGDNELTGVNLLSVYANVGFGNMETGDFLFT